MMQSIISGVLKGTRLHPPENSDVRPTSSRVREAVFSLLQGDIRGVRFLDGFSGTGAIGLEALSRGADQVYFVEKSKQVSRVLRKNLSLCLSKLDQTDEGSTPTEVLVSDYLHIKPFLKDNIFDIIWCDPPYDLYSSKCKNFLELSRKIISDNGILLLESHLEGRKILEQEILSQPSFKERKVKKYGKTFVTIIDPI